jgi:predicted permease
MNLRFWRYRRRDSDLEEEIRSHLNLAAAERIERGESETQAAASVRREFGNIGLIREITREFWGWASLERIGQDIRFGTRVLTKSPAFTIIAILTLALGIGANTALFSVVNGVLLNPLPYPEPDRLVTLHESKPNFETGSVSYPNFLDWQRENHSFSAMAIARPFGFTYTGNGTSEQITAEFVSSDFFSLLGVKPRIGRMFLQDEDKIGAAPIALIGAGFWKRKFAASEDVLGKSVELNGMNYTVVGVVPESFNFNAMNFSPSEVYLPVGQWDNPLLTSRVAGLAFHGLGRLKPGVSLQQARDDMDAVCRGLEETYPEADKGIRANLKPLRESVIGGVQPILLVLLGAVAFVLLIACVNVANLLIARSTGRAREFAIRIALGAGRARLLRQLVTESLLLSITGGALGLLLAFWGTKAALASLPSALPRADEVGIDLRVLLFTLGISIAAGLIFGLAPALKILKPRIQTTLSEGGRSLSSSRQRVHGIFAVVEVALALVLLVGAGLLARSMAALWRVDPGFRSDHVLTFGLNLSPSLINAKPDAIRATLRELDARLESTQGVRSSSLSWGAFPMSGDDELVFWLDDQPKPASPNDMHWALKYVVEPHYLDVMRIPLLRGRFFSATDDEHTAPVVVVDDVFARKYFGDEDPIGKRLRFDTGMNNVSTSAEIIGVVGHVKQWGVDLDDQQQLRTQTYVPFMQMPGEPMSLVPAGTTVALRFDGSSSGVFDRIRETLRQMNSEQVVYSALTMDEIIAGSLASQRFSMILLGGFAALALILSAIGIYGVISYLVAQRTNEIGIRMALGAQRSDVLKLIVGHGARMALMGIAIGVVAALALTRLMSTMLFGVTSHDPLTFVAVAMVLIGVALFASYVPALRATRVDPVVALRYE